MARNRKINRAKKKLGQLYDLSNMSKEEILELAKIEKDNSIGTKNQYGFTDYTPYNAITGKEVISSGKVTNPISQVPSGFNTVKK